MKITKYTMILALLIGSSANLALASEDESGAAATFICDFNNVKNHDYGDGVMSFTIDSERAKVSVKCTQPGKSGFCMSGDQANGKTAWVLKSVVNFDGFKTDFSMLGKSTNMYIVEGNNQDDQEFLLNIMVSSAVTIKNGVRTVRPTAQAYITVMEGYNNLEGNTDIVSCHVVAK